MSVPGIFLAQVAQFLQLQEWGLDTSRAVSVIGHSQGIFGVRLCEGRADAGTILAIAELIGAAMPRVSRAHGLVESPDGMPIQAFIGVTRTELENAMTQVAPDAYVGLVNSTTAVVGVGRPEDLRRVGQLCPQARRIPLPIPVGTHHPAMEAAVRQVAEWAGACGIDPELASGLAHYVLVRRVDWVEDTSVLVSSGAIHVLDLGPGPGMASATVRNIDGHGMEVLSIATAAGQRALLDAPLPPAPAPEVVSATVDSPPEEEPEVPEPTEATEPAEPTEPTEPTVLDEMRDTVLGEDGALASAARGILRTLRCLEKPRLPEEPPTGLEALLQAEFGTDWVQNLRSVLSPETTHLLGEFDDNRRTSVLLTGALSCPDAVNTICRYLAEGRDVIAGVDTREPLPAGRVDECRELWHSHARDGAALLVAEVNEASLRDMEALARLARDHGVEEMTVYSGVSSLLPRSAVTGVETLVGQLAPGRDRRLRVRLAPESCYTPEINYGHRLIRGRWPWDVIWERAAGSVERPEPLRVQAPEWEGPVLADPDNAVVMVDAPGVEETEPVDLEQGLGRLLLGDADVVHVGDREAPDGFLLARGQVARDHGWEVRAVVSGGPDAATALRRCGLGDQGPDLTPTGDGTTPVAGIRTLVDALDRGRTGALTTSQGWYFAVAHPEVFRRSLAAARR